MSLSVGDQYIPPQGQRRGRYSLFREHPSADTPDTAAAAAQPEERHELNIGDPHAAMERMQARRGWRVAESNQPLMGGMDADGTLILPPPMVPVEVACRLDAEGHVILPLELIARQAAEAAEEEKQRIADLTPARLDELQGRRWRDWFARYELHRPDFLRLSTGPRAEMLARRSLTIPEWIDEDERHPDGGRVIVRGMLTPPAAEQPRAFATPRVLDAIREQLLSATWLPEESHPRKGLPPEQAAAVRAAVARWQEEERKREAGRRYGAYRGSGVNW